MCAGAGAEKHMLTRDVVRELLLNAINHKDYATGVPIQVSVHEDCIKKCFGSFVVWQQMAFFFWSYVSAWVCVRAEVR